MLKRILLAFAAIAVLLTSVLLYVWISATRLPHNKPASMCGGDCNAGGRKVLACIGDSITHGAVSANYVEMLEKRLESSKFTVINAGVNSELAYNALARIDDVIRCRPDYVTVLIGTNDANATLSETNTARYMRSMKLPRRPDINWYRMNLSQICRVLRAGTNAKVALLSIPPIGEKMDSPETLRSIEYAAVAKEVARAEKVAYLPLNETMVACLARHNPVAKHPYSAIDRVMFAGVFKHFILRKGYDAISHENGFLLLTDFLHLNSLGAGMVTDLIEGFIAKEESKQGKK
jgi:lysophospholipase L1-like esterase